MTPVAPPSGPAIDEPSQQSIRTTASRPSSFKHESADAGGPSIVAALCGAACVLAGVVVLIVGWLLNVELVRSLIPGTVAMKTGTAAMFVLSGTALLLVPSTGIRRRVGYAAAGACLLLALAFMAEVVLGWNLGIDEFPFRDSAGRAAHVPSPGRLAPATAGCFVFVSVGLMMLRSPRRVEEGLMVPVVAVAGLCLVGYAYSIPVFYGPGSATKMAVNTGILFLVLALGVTLAAPGGRLQHVLHTHDPGTVMARRLLPFTILVPLVLGRLSLAGIDNHLFGSRVGIWVLTAATVAGLMFLVVRAGLSISVADRLRRDLETQLQRLAGEDVLTKLPNRRNFEELLVREIALASRYGTPAALLMVDLDRFKEVNDEHGHATGDQLLECVADALKGRLRNTDIVGRLGGDEFVAYLPRTDLHSARHVAEDLCMEIARASRSLGEATRTTASIGVCADPHGSQSSATMLGAGDRAMYVAKRGGGDRVAVADASHERPAGRVPSPAITHARRRDARPA